MDIVSYLDSTALVGSTIPQFYDTPGYRAHYTLQSGTLPPGLTVTTGGDGRGYLSGAPTTIGTYTFTILATQDLDSGVTATIDTTLDVTFPTVNSGSLPTSGRVGSNHYIQFQIENGEPVTWAISAGTFTPGLILDASTGIVTYWPTAAGSFTFTVTATSVANSAYSSSLETTMVVATTTVTIIHTPLGPIDQGLPYSGEFEIDYDSDELAFDFPSGGLPTGIMVNKWGDVSGTTSVAPGTYNFTVRATVPGTTISDSWATSVEVTANTPPVITTTSIPDGLVYVQYSAEISVTGSQPITWTVTSGALPAGITLTSFGGNALLSGIALTTSSSTFTLQAVNALGTDTQVLTLSITTAYEGGTPLPTFFRPEPDGRTVIGYAIHEADGSTTYLTGFSQVFVQNGTVTLLSSGLSGWPAQSAINTLDTAFPTTGPSGDVSFTAVAANRNGTVTRTFTAHVTPRADVGDGFHFEVWIRHNEGFEATLVFIPNPFYSDLGSSASASLGTVTGPLDYGEVLVGSDPLNKWLPWAIGFNPGPGDITYNAGADVITIHEAGVGAYAEDISGVWGGLPDRHIFLTVHIFDPADLDTGDADTILVSPPQATRLRTTDTPVVEIGSDTIECSITIIGATPTIECADPPDAEVGVAYTHQFAVSGGTVRVTGGALPPGLSVNAAGLVTGTPTTPGTFSFKVKTIA